MTWETDTCERDYVLLKRREARMAKYGGVGVNGGKVNCNLKWVRVRLTAKT